MVKLIKIVTLFLILILSGLIGVWMTVPYWLPTVSVYFLPKNVQLTLQDRPQLVRSGVVLPKFTLSVDQCIWLDAAPIDIRYQARFWQISTSRLIVDTSCQYPQYPEEDKQSPIVIDLPQIQRTLPEFSLIIDELTIAPWAHYAGQLILTNNHQQQSLKYQGQQFNALAVLDNAQHLTLQQLWLELPERQGTIKLQGEIQWAGDAIPLPVLGKITGEVSSEQLIQPIIVRADWQEMAGGLQITEEDLVEPLLDLTWYYAEKKLVLENGKWFWPYFDFPLRGGLSVTLSDWSETFNEATAQLRANVITEGHSGKGNAVLTFGPERIRLQDNQVRFQLTGKASLANIAIYASIPGMLTNSLTNPVINVLPGALLRAKGEPAPDLILDEVRLPLAGVRFTTKGITGRLQAIFNVTHRYWGKFKLHLDGKAESFLPDQGIWQWNFWGNGQLPVLKAKWDVSGKGQWQDEILTVERLSSGFDRMKYGRVTVSAPRLSLLSPLVWQRQQNQFNAQWLVQTQKITSSLGSSLPKTSLNLTLTGQHPNAFNWKGELKSLSVGPIRLSGRWDGERLRGEAWWPKQSLTVFQSLLPQDLGMKINNGTIYAQAAFSASDNQGFEAGGHVVVQNGGMWLKDGELEGLDFIASYRLKDHLWQIGPKGPVSLTIKRLQNLFDLQDISASLQGTYPYSAKRPLTLSNVSISTLQGTLKLASFSLPQTQPAVLQINHIELSELFTVLKPKQVAMSGKINGELPVYLDNVEWLVLNGWIENDGYLTLRLDKDLVDSIATDNMTAGAVMDWLRYMEISRSRADVTITNLGVLTLDAQLKGINSSKNRERPVVLNYHHEENIFQLWRSLRFGDNLQEYVEQHLSLPRSH